MGVFDAQEGSMYYYDKSLENLKDGELEDAVEAARKAFEVLENEGTLSEGEIRTRTEAAISYIRDDDRSEAISQLRTIRTKVQQIQAKNLHSNLSGMR